ncbi:hypothetical protein L1987_02294 [Smallanthus sonchifolius]|uniref:Uncharacterized protein n=1 Tax=Smallanthus sonchifolius TaxID=185202 RepID=A0ACB9K7D0_9ASTR|nr:hypothetical protein L1987_02294 [Smallanthus sonchifolius]
MEKSSTQEKPCKEEVELEKQVFAPREEGASGLRDTRDPEISARLNCPSRHAKKQCPDFATRYIRPFGLFWEQRRSLEPKIEACEYALVTPCILGCIEVVRLRGDLSFRYFSIVGETER